MSANIDPEAMWCLRELARAFAVVLVRRVASGRREMPLRASSVRQHENARRYENARARAAEQRRQAEADRERFIAERRIA